MPAAATNAEATAALALAALAIILLHWLAWQAVRLLALAARRLPPRLTGARAWARAHPVRAALERRFPRTYGFLARRLTPRPFTGLPLTLMVLAAVYLASLFGGLVQDLLEAEELVAFDHAVNDSFKPYRETYLVDVLAWITDLGGSPALIAVALVATGFLWADRRPRFIPPLWITFAGAHATTYLGKFGFARGRPEFLTEVTALTPSFPSGHATGSLAVYGFVAYAIARDLPVPALRGRFELAFWTLVLVACIGFSRMFLSVHYASDVAAGFLVGGFWLLVGFAVYEYLRQGDADAGARAAAASAAAAARPDAGPADDGGTTGRGAGGGFRG